VKKPKIPIGKHASDDKEDSLSISSEPLSEEREGALL